MSKFKWGKKGIGVFLLWATAGVVLPAQTLTTLHSFNGTDGALPSARLVQATDGNFYGTTELGGGNIGCGNPSGCGTVFTITPSGTLTTLYNFCSQINCADGSEPYAGLIQATDGNLYGTTAIGGASNSGTVFKISRNATLTTLHSFDGADGYVPNGLVQAANGNFYGTTNRGGSNGFGGICTNGCGTVFTITPSGTLTTLYFFGYWTDGANSGAGLVQAANGNFYGTTLNGGPTEDGTVFTITPSGTLTTLHSFNYQTEGVAPVSGLVQGGNGDFYGTTWVGGSCLIQGGCGTIFTITSSGTLTTLHAFDATDGNSPLGGVVRGTDGNFYGPTLGYGANGGGTVYKITPSGAFTTLYNFCSQSNCSDGSGPYAGLIQATDGQFYGTTQAGGANNDGTVFSLSVSLGPFVKTQPASGKVGAPVKILGTDLTGATSVTFNGTAAIFTVKSSSLITTTVPAGATSGKVQVVTFGNGTLSSNMPFLVRP